MAAPLLRILTILSVDLMPANKRKTSYKFKGRPVYTANGRYFTIKANGMWEFVAKKKLGMKTSPSKKKTSKRKRSTPKRTKGGKKMSSGKTSMLRRVRQVAVAGGALGIPALRAKQVYDENAGDLFRTAMSFPELIIGVNSQGDPNDYVKEKRSQAAMAAGATIGIDYIASKGGVYQHLGNLFKR
jgi:hypothetical protein